MRKYLSSEDAIAAFLQRFLEESECGHLDDDDVRAGIDAEIAGFAPSRDDLSIIVSPKREPPSDDDVPYYSSAESNSLLPVTADGASAALLTAECKVGQVEISLAFLGSAYGGKYTRTRHVASGGNHWHEVSYQKGGIFIEYSAKEGQDELLDGRLREWTHQPA